MLSASTSMPCSSIARMRSCPMIRDWVSTFSPISAIASGTAQCACTSTVLTRRPLTTTSRRRTVPPACACAFRAARRSQPTKAMPAIAPVAFLMNSLRVDNDPPGPVMRRHASAKGERIPLGDPSPRKAWFPVSFVKGHAAPVNSTPIGQLRIQLITAIAVIVVSIWGTVAYQLASERGAELRSAAQHGKNLSGIVAEHFSSYAGGADLFLKRLRVQWTRDRGRFAEAVAVEKGLRKDVFVVQVSVIGADGWLAYTDLPESKQRVFLGDREHFRAHRAGGPDQLYISNPLKGRVSGKLSIQSTRALLDRSGRFAGVLVLSVSPQALIRVYEALDLGSNGLVGIRRLDNTRLLRWPDLDATENVPSLEIPSNASTGNQIRRGNRDGVERLLSYRKVPDFPLYAVVGQSLDSLLLDSSKGRLFYLSAGAFGFLVVLLLGLMMLSSLKRGEHVENELIDSERRFRSLTGLSSDMYWEQDDQYRFTSSSGSGPEWIVNGKKRWDFKYDNMSEADWAAHIALLDARKPFRDLELCRAPSGRKVWVSVSGEPIFDASGAFKGYRGVGRAITERKRAEQLQSLEHTVSRSLAEADSVTAAVQAAVRSICETEGWECGRYFRWDDKAHMLRFSDAWGISDDAVQQFLAKSRELSYAAGVGLAGKVWQSRQPLWAGDITQDTRVDQVALPRGAGMRGAFV